MKTHYLIIDKTAWPRGPWDDEPDIFEWWDEETGLFCLARRNPHFGIWCGYVGVPPHYTTYGKPYEDTIFYDLTPHGGITFAGEVPEEPWDLWYFGFDCGHFPDYTPALAAREIQVGWETYGGVESYRTLEYVKEQCTLLARQLWQIQVDVVAERIKRRSLKDHEHDYDRPCPLTDLRHDLPPRRPAPIT